MKKYYIEHVPFLSSNEEKWNLLVQSLDSNDTFIEIVEEIIESTDSLNRKKITQLLSGEVHYFKSQQPIEKTITLHPFFTKMDFISVCSKYKLTNKLINELSTDWKKELLDTCVISPFVVYKLNQPIIWCNLYGTTLLLGKNELKLFQSVGFSLENYNEDLNALYYGIF